MKFSFDYQANGYDESKPLIYVWHVGGRIYVGKSEKGARRPLNHYRRNVERYFAGKPYRASNPDGWRLVHRAMFDAVENRESIRLELVANVEPSEDIYAIEEQWRVRLEADLNG
jgi:hypothetical protein